MLLDCGFFGTGEEYCWTLSADVYSPALATYLHTFQVNKMNTGNVNLGDHLVYKVFYANSKLYVFDTQQLTTYDYRGVQDTSGSQLIYAADAVRPHEPDQQRNGDYGASRAGGQR